MSDGGKAAIVIAAVVLALLAWSGANHGNRAYPDDDQGVCSRALPQNC